METPETRIPGRTPATAVGPKKTPTTKGVPKKLEEKINTKYFSKSN